MQSLIELKKQHVKKAHRSFNRMKGKHKARRAQDSAFPRPYENSSSRVGGEDFYGLHAEEVTNTRNGNKLYDGSGVCFAKGKKKQNKKFKKNLRQKHFNVAKPMDEVKDAF